LTSSSPSLARNTAFNASGSAVRLGLGLRVTPVLLQALGTEVYGLWVVIWTFSGSLGVIDLRLGAAATPLIAAARESAQDTRIARLAQSGFFLYGMISLSAIAAAICISRTPVLTAWLPDDIQADVRFALPAAVVVFAMANTASLLRGLLQGLQRYDITSKITFSISTLRAVVLISIAVTGGRLRELVLAEVAMSAVDFVVCAVAARGRVPGFRFIARPDAQSLRQLLSFGSKLEIAHLAHLVALHLDKLLLSTFLGLEAVAFYDVGARIVGVIRSLPLLLVSATLPVASALDAAGKRERLWSFYENGTRALAWTGLPLFLWTALGAGSVLLVWTDVQSIEAHMTVWILCVGMFFNVYSGMANSVALGIGKPEIEMRRSLIAGGLNVVLSLVLLWWLGFAGAPLGTSLALMAGSGYLIGALHRHFGRSLQQLFAPLVGPLLTAVPAGIAAWFILAMAGESLFGHLAGLAGAALAIGLIFLVSGSRAGVFTQDFLRSVRNPAAND
jgi:O-antigen/teichoic acid export membrane protein